LPFLLLLLLGTRAAAIAWHFPETVKRPVQAWSKLSLRPRVGVPRAIVPSFLAPAITAFSTFSLLYSALAPSLLQQALHVESHPIGGAVVFELYAVATLVLALAQWVDARAESPRRRRRSLPMRASPWSSPPLRLGRSSSISGAAGHAPRRDFGSLRNYKKL
jgi:hypothetical protein